MILGVDGCKKGWVAVTLNDDGRILGVLASESLEDVLTAVPGARVVGVDMPLHLLDAPSRPADELARQALGSKRGNSVFPALPRFSISATWLDRDFDSLNRECRRRLGRAFSRQSVALRQKIAEVNAAFEAGHPLIEVHPELSFATMNAGRPLTHSKKSWGGQRERLELLNGNGLVIPEELPAIVDGLPADDIIDAAAAAWSAHRHFRGEASSFPPAATSPTTPRIWF